MKPFTKDILRRWSLGFYPARVWQTTIKDLNIFGKLLILWIFDTARGVVFWVQDCSRCSIRKVYSRIKMCWLWFLFLTWGVVCPTLPVFSSPTSSHTRLTSKNYSIQVKLFIKFVCLCQFDTVKADLEVIQKSIIWKPSFALPQLNRITLHVPHPPC